MRDGPGMRPGPYGNGGDFRVRRPAGDPYVRSGPMPDRRYDERYIHRRGGYSR